MKRSVAWWRGDRAVGYQVERALNAASSAAESLEILRDNPRRRILRIEKPDGGAILVKHFRVGSGKHMLRERIKSRLGVSPAEREWRALVAMKRTGLRVPEALSLGTLADGDHVLAMEFVESRALDDWLREGIADQNEAAAALGRVIAAVHESGWIHGDLHVGNLLYNERNGTGVFSLIDWQHARLARNERERVEDIAHLEHSLSRFLPLSIRMRFRESALGVSRPYDAGARKALRAIGDAVHTRFYEHARSRTRRALRPGRLYAPAEIDTHRGLRTRDLSERDLRRILRLHESAHASGTKDPRVIKRDARSAVSAIALAERRVVVKEFPPRGFARALADRFRGSPARRAWLGGHALIARRIGVAQPLAYLEETGLAMTPRSWVVLEDLRPATPAAFAAERGVLSAEALADQLLALLLSLHRRGVDHGDLKATHILLRRGRRPSACLIDLEGVRTRRSLAWPRRRRALVELNASLPDSFPAALRRQIWDRYIQIFPPPGGAEHALRDIVAESLGRQHRWSGRDCGFARDHPVAGSRKRERS